MVKLDFCLIFALSVVFLLSISGVSAQQTCNREQDCDSVSLGREYVTCRNRTCVCWTERGFVGNATLANKCRCVAPRSVYQVPNRGPRDRDDDDDRNGGRDDDRRGSVDDFYCVNIANATAQVAENDRCLILENVTRTIYKLTEYPNNLPILSGQLDLHPFISPDSHSRFTPAGEFTGFEGFIEYYYGLGSTRAGFVQETKFRTIACDNNVVHFRVDLLFNQLENPLAPPIALFNFTHFGFFVFNKQNLIEVADVTFANMGITADIPADAVVVIPPNPEPIRTRDAFIAGLCFQVMPTFCTGANQQFSDPNECLGFMYSIPWGSFDRGNSNTLTCRLIHSGLVAARPDVHCKHVGPTGGGKCINFTAASYYQSILETTLNQLVPQN